MKKRDTEISAVRRTQVPSKSIVKIKRHSTVSSHNSRKVVFNIPSLSRDSGIPLPTYIPQDHLETTSNIVSYPVSLNKKPVKKVGEVKKRTQATKSSNSSQENSVLHSGSSSEIKTLLKFTTNIEAIESKLNKVENALSQKIEEKMPNIDQSVSKTLPSSSNKKTKQSIKTEKTITEKVDSKPYNASDYMDECSMNSVNQDCEVSPYVSELSRHIVLPLISESSTNYVYPLEYDSISTVTAIRNELAEWRKSHPSQASSFSVKKVGVSSDEFHSPKSTEESVSRDTDENEDIWSARADAVKALVKGYKEIKKSLKQISEDPTQKPAVQVEALGLENNFGNFEIAFLAILWNDILERFDKVSKSLQSETLNLAVGKTQLQTLESYLNDRRDEFDKYEQNVMTFLQVESPSYKRIRTRKTFADETIGNEAHLDGRTMFKTQVYIRIIDSLISNLSRRKLAYEHLADKFEILSTLVQKESQNEAISQAANKLYASYPNDIGSEFENECLHFKMYVEQEEFSGIHDVYEYIITNELKSTFPNLEVAVRIFLTLPVTNCSAERGFSALNRLKNVKRSALSDNKLNCLMLLCCEKDLTLSTDFSDVVNKFAKLKARKKSVI